MRTSSATNVGDGKDSEARQRKAIEDYAQAVGTVIVDWFYDAAVSGVPCGSVSSYVKRGIRGALLKDRLHLYLERLIVDQKVAGVSLLRLTIQHSELFAISETGPDITR